MAKQSELPKSTTPAPIDDPVAQKVAAMTIDCFCDYDQPEFYHHEIRRARKPHKCDECNGRILPDDRYEHVRGKWGDYINTYNTCEACVDIRTWTKNNVPCLCWAHGSLIEDCKLAIEEARYRAPSETLGLRFGFLRRKVLRDRRHRFLGTA